MTDKQAVLHLDPTAQFLSWGELRPSDTKQMGWIYGLQIETSVCDNEAKAWEVALAIAVQIAEAKQA